MSESKGLKSSSRREFLKRAGVAGAGLVAGSMGGGNALAAGAEGAAPPTQVAGGAPASSVDFGRIFPNLPPFADASNPAVANALLEVGMQGGILDAGDQLSAGPMALILTPGVNGNPRRRTRTERTRTTRP
jgi:hypothetical protein